MPYAADGQISKRPIDDGVEISDEKYDEARSHALSGGLIKTHNGSVILTSKPEKKEGHEEPVWQNGDWHHEPMPEKTPEEIEEQKKQTIRRERDQLLRETDYLLMPDYPDKPAGIESYRQALRDITEQSGFPESVEWPVKP